MQRLITNLVPEERQHRLEREYYLRLGVVASFLITALVVAAGALLLPTYVYLGTSEHSKQIRLASITSTLSSADESALSARLAALTNDASALLALQNAPSAAHTISDVLAIPRAGVTLSAFRYVPPAANVRGTLTISGMAATRDALRNYQLALQGASFIQTADLPVSAYAKDSNIPFSVALTLKP